MDWASLVILDHLASTAPTKILPIYGQVTAKIILEAFVKVVNLSILYLVVIEQ
jgi:hypothetical protein